MTDDLFNPLIYIPRYFKVINKQGQLVPMTLFPAQEYYVKNKAKRNVVLKNRQTGMSTGIMADNSHALFTEPHQRQTIITHDQETSEFLFQTVERFYKNLPPELKPKTSWKSGTRMKFSFLDSYIYIDSAKSDNIGIGHTMNRVHLSEFAKWPANRAKALFADISQTVPLDGIITVESTPKGRFGEFYELYSDAKNGNRPYKAFFFPWWWDVTATIPDFEQFMTPGYLEKVAVKLNVSLREIESQENYLRNNQNCTTAQVAFRRLKIMELGDLFFQEYPENDIDCWLSSEVAAIDGLTLKKYFAEIKPGRSEGDFITIWKDSIGGHQYVIGVDVAAGIAKGDYSVASVIDTRNLEYAARIRGRMSPDMFGEMVLKMGHRFNDAEIGVEKTGHGHTVIRVLLERNYPNIYCHKDYDEITRGVTFDYGWRTSFKSKPLMIDDMSASLRASDLISYSENLLIEASGLIIEKTAGGTSKINKGTGFDDEWDAVSIALQLRNATPMGDIVRSEPQRYARII